MANADWSDLPLRLRQRVREHLGTLGAATPGPPGSAAQLTATLETASGKVFVKGVRLDHPRADLGRIELKVQHWLPHVAPRLCWQLEDDQWLLMFFEHVSGRHADLGFGSADLPLIAATLTDMSNVHQPDLPVLPIEQRWARFGSTEDLERLRGDVLVHCDLTAANILVDDRIRVVDWAWPTLGAAWLDTAFLVTRLIQAGHQPVAAEHWAQQIPAWATATNEAIAVFIAARRALGERHGRDQIIDAVDRWAAFRQT
jgi:hypothetical protein